MRLETLQPTTLLAWTLPAAVNVSSELVLDDFGDARPPGQVGGTRSTSGAARIVIDQESRISIDAGALRLPPAQHWGTMGIGYGPYRRAPGLALAARLRLADALIWDSNPHKLAAGWFAEANPVNPETNGYAVLFAKSAGGMRGALRVSGGHGTGPLVDDLMQLDLQVIAIFRAESVMYYLASARGVPGLAAYPAMRPVGMALAPQAELFAFVHQRHQRDDFHATRLEGIQVATLPGLAHWYGTAAVADELTGRSRLEGRRTPAGATSWAVEEGHLQLTAEGAKASGAPARALACLSLPQPAGIVAAVLETGNTPGLQQIIFRRADRANYWRLAFTATEARLSRMTGGAETVAARSSAHPLGPKAKHHVWIVDDGEMMRCYLDGELALQAKHRAHSDSAGAGFGFENGDDGSIHHFEVHPRELPIPVALRLGEPYQRLGGSLVVADDFKSGAGHLAGRRTPVGGLEWERTGGPGNETIELLPEGGGRANRENSFFIAYTVPWDNPSFADVSCELTPPSLPKEGHVGLVLSQDDRNFLMLGWDTPTNYFGLWCTIGGIWQPVDLIVPDIPTGKPHTLRATCDGDNYILYLNQEPIIIAKISDTFVKSTGIRINRVGIGLTRFKGKGDQGTVFRNFVVRK